MIIYFHKRKSTLIKKGGELVRIPNKNQKTKTVAANHNRSSTIWMTCFAESLARKETDTTNVQTSRLQTSCAADTVQVPNAMALATKALCGTVNPQPTDA